MRILVVGGSRGIGRQTVKQALEEGHEVSVFSRNPSALGLDNPKLHLKTGDVLDISSLENAMKGMDIVICTLGLTTRQAIGPPLTKASHVLSEGTKNILAAMKARRVKRLICVTAVGTGDSASKCSVITKLTLRYGLRWLFKEKDIQERLIEDGQGLDWTIIRPTILTDGPKKGVTQDNNIRVGLLTHVSRADVAAFMLDIINQKGSYGKALIVSYPPKLGDSFRWVAGYFGLN